MQIGGDSMVKHAEGLALPVGLFASALVLRKRRPLQSRIIRFCTRQKGPPFCENGCCFAKKTSVLKKLCCCLFEPA